MSTKIPKNLHLLHLVKPSWFRQFSSSESFKKQVSTPAMLFKTDCTRKQNVQIFVPILSLTLSRLQRSVYSVRATLHGFFLFSDSVCVFIVIFCVLGIKKYSRDVAQWCVLLSGKRRVFKIECSKFVDFGF